jgi:hypothetical protein
VTCSALVTVGTQYGLGRHMADIETPEMEMNAIKFTVIAPALSILTTMSGKVSVVLFLWRLRESKIHAIWMLLTTC